MKTYLHAFAMCQSMFCAIPCPGRIWDEQARGKMLLFLPVVGLEIGGIWVLVLYLVGLLKLPSPMGAMAMCACPYLLTGFLHLDGFMDVTDAVKSWRSPERRREILKDSHVGSFAVIAVVLLILFQFASFSGGSGSYPVLVLIPVVSRCCSALAVTALPPMTTSQFAGQEKPKSHMVFFLCLLAAALAAGFLLAGWNSLALLAELAGYGLALRRGYRSLEGMNGDIAGYSLTIAEACAAVVWVLV